MGCASQGTGSGDERRLQELLSHFKMSLLPFNRKNKVSSFQQCLRRLKQSDFDLFVIEGTGFAVGLAAILARLFWKRRYVLSSGDAVAPFLSGKVPAAALLFQLYERALYRCSSGFIGWTPYLVGRALTMGAKRAITIPGWAPDVPSPHQRDGWRRSVREELGIPQNAVVFGLAGSLTWSDRYQFCYGAELVRAAALCTMPPILLIVGDGTGLAKLRELAGQQIGRTVFLPGRVAKKEVPRYLAAMDVGSLPQSVDSVGSFRYTTKLPEYRAAGLLVLTNQIPMAYDLDEGDMLRLPGDSPWDPVYLASLRDLMQDLTPSQVIEAKRGFRDHGCFSRSEQLDHVTAFLSDLIQDFKTKEGRIGR